MDQLQPAPPPRRPAWMWAGGLAGLVLAGSMFLNNYTGPRSGAAASKPVTGAFLVSGTVTLGDGASFTKGADGGCAGTGAHADVIDGAVVIIATTGGLASGTLTAPRTLDDDTCLFSFSVPEVPNGQDTYLLMIADQDIREYAEQELTGALVNVRLD